MKLEPTVSVRPPRPKDKDEVKPEPENQTDLMKLVDTNKETKKDN